MSGFLLRAGCCGACCGITARPEPDHERTWIHHDQLREFDRLKMVQAIVEMGLKPGRAAERLGLSVRQVERLVHFCSGARKNGQLDLWGLNFEQWIKLPLPRMGITHWVCPSR
ncbi:hypothetical protein GGD41_004199 [Paraburkholderia bryophila]|uniref:Helix-turn-helix protein n=1 Tax=Paraburkholderia bryophila TaxID=420952 RepID=A0A7Z0B0N9_9BURK|nr:hypothetical protein [Paraburkholderia bryophila]